MKKDPDAKPKLGFALPVGKEKMRPDGLLELSERGPPAEFIVREIEGPFASMKRERQTLL
jgi:hypothetical protein